MKTIAVAMLMFGIVASPVQAGEYLQTLKEGCWVCETPQAYDLAIAEERKQNAGLEDLKQRLLEQKLCIYADTAFVSRIMVPYAKVLERHAGDRLHPQPRLGGRGGGLGGLQAGLGEPFEFFQ